MRAQALAAALDGTTSVPIWDAGHMADQAASLFRRKV